MKLEASRPVQIGGSQPSVAIQLRVGVRVRVRFTVRVRVRFTVRLELGLGFGLG